MSKYYLVVDGGATKTVVSLRNQFNHSFAEVEGSGSNFQVIGLPSFTKVIRNLVQEILVTHRIEMVDIILFALAGIDSKEDQVLINDVLTKIFRDIQLSYRSLVVENDAHATLLGLTQSEPGVLVISGTGSIAYAHDGKGQVTRAGGWGHRSGDEGSGYWIGKKILQAIYRMEDGRNSSTLLRELVYNYLAINTIEELSQWLYGSTYSVDQLANLSHLLPLAYEKKDPIATEIFDKTSLELVYLAVAVIRSSNIQSKSCTIYFNGGTICNFESLFLVVKEKLESKFPSKQVELCIEPPINSIYDRAKGLNYE